MNQFHIDRCYGQVAESGKLEKNNLVGTRIFVEAGWTRPKAAKSTWDKAALAAANANSKALNAIFCGISPDEFHRISHITVTKEV